MVVQRNDPSLSFALPNATIKLGLEETISLAMQFGGPGGEQVGNGEKVRLNG